VLPTERIGIHDNFFELNGNSIQLVQIHALLEKTFNREFSIVDLFQYPTIASLAEMLDGAEGAQPAIEETYQRAEMRGKSRRESRRKRREASEQEGSE
jgi:acyl carrier protein